MTRRRSISGFTLFVAVALIASVAWADQFRHLTASEIRAQVVGKRITDDGHWSQIFERSGRLVVNDLGHRRRAIAVRPVLDRSRCRERMDALPADI